MFFFTAGRFRIGPCQVRPPKDVFERSSDSLVPSARCPPRLYRVLDAYRHVVRIVCWKTFLLLPFFPVQLSFLLPLSYISHTIPFHYSIPILILCACGSRLGHRRRRHDDVRHSFLMVFQLCSPLSLLNNDNNRGVGCIFFEMASGRPLFPGSTVEDQLQLIFSLLGILVYDYLIKTLLPSNLASRNTPTKSTFHCIHFVRPMMQVHRRKKRGQAFRTMRTFCPTASIIALPSR